MRLGRGWHKAGTRLGQGWDEVGTRLAQGWDEVGTRLGRGWDEVGMRLTRLGQGWDKAGTRLGRGWDEAVVSKGVMMLTYKKVGSGERADMRGKHPIGHFNAQGSELNIHL